MSVRGWTADLHLRLARRAAVHTRVTRAASLAAVATALGWLLGLTPTAHAAVLVTGAALGALLPVRAPTHAAWRSIAEQAGLAYQTHVEHAERDDPYGLLAATSVQAQLSVRAVVPPRQGAWWLPLAALAVTIWLLGAVLGPPTLWSGADTNATPATSASPPTPTPPAMPGVDEAAADEGDLADEPPDTPPSAPSQPRSSRPADSAGADAASDGAAGALERDELDRFLDGLRERPVSPEADAATRDIERSDLRDGGDADLESAELRDDPSAEDADAALTPSDARDADGAPEQRVELPGAGGEGDSEQADGEAPEDGSDGAASEPSPDGQDAGPGEAADGDENDQGAPSADAGEEGSQQAALGGDQPGFDEGTGDDAGAGIGPPQAAQDGIPEPGGELEALPGLLRSGPESPAGRVRLPGRDSELAPQGAAATSFERAVEQAVTDGSVPVTYQEIIRNYFR